MVKFFCDFDGVLNVFPYKKVWVGDDDNDFSYSSLYNPDNWKIERIDPTSKDFVPDDSFQAKDSGRTFDITYSTEMINEINSMEEDGLFEFVWLTTWQGFTKSLDEQLGFSKIHDSLPWYNREGSASQIGKYHAIRDFYSDTQTFEPFIWVDDVATERFVSPFMNVRGQSEEAFPGNNSPHLIIQTTDTYGISKDEMEKIRRFAEENKE